MLTVEKLKNYGANVEEGLERCMNNEAFYLRMVDMAIGNDGFDKLAAAVEKGEVPQIFEAAHALKGMLGHLALTPLFQQASEITELARAGTDADYAALHSKLKEEQKKLQALREES